MRVITTLLVAPALLSCVALIAVTADTVPVPPVKSGLWEVRSSALDADGRETAPREQAALSRLSPEARARMAEAMKARGVSMPDADGTIKVCLTKESFQSGGWQQLAAQSGCTTTFNTRSNTMWKWHSSCTALGSESDGEVVFNNAESYRTKMTTTATLRGKTTTTTRIVSSKWVGADCGAIKPIMPAGVAK